MTAIEDDSFVKNLQECKLIQLKSKLLRVKRGEIVEVESNLQFIVLHVYNEWESIPSKKNVVFYFSSKEACNDIDTPLIKAYDGKRIFFMSICKNDVVFLE